MKKLVTRFRAKTPLVARMLQALCGALVFLPNYYSTLPLAFQGLNVGELKMITIAALVAAFLLNFTKKTEL